MHGFPGPLACISPDLKDVNYLPPHSVAPENGKPYIQPIGVGRTNPLLEELKSFRLQNALTTSPIDQHKYLDSDKSDVDGTKKGRNDLLLFFAFLPAIYSIRTELLVQM